MQKSVLISVSGAELHERGYKNTPMLNKQTMQNITFFIEEKDKIVLYSIVNRTENESSRLYAKKPHNVMGLF